MAQTKRTARRALVHLAGGRRVPAAFEDVFFLEVGGDETLARTRGRRTLRDVRSQRTSTASARFG